MQHDTLSDALSAINNAARKGNNYATISPTSNLIQNVLLKLQDEGYIGVFELIEDGKGGKYKVEVKEAVNKCEPVKPNFYVGSDEHTEWAKRYLPARNFGKLIVTTPRGVLTHDEAVEENVGGKLLGYVY
ncbi:MAG: 30S ribosomal protein S8 [Nanohaloarchaea archaeon]|nr:30S ribosomal protein S8 [Candidatus Nanohaloarchaea archaeon]